MKLNKVLKEGETLLLDNDKEKHISKYLIKYLLNYKEEDIINNKNITKHEYKKFIEAISKYIKGEALQYITKQQSFLDLNIYVNKNVLIPRPETELLTIKTIDYINKHFKNPIIADICTGSGCIALAIKKRINRSIVYATDISLKALNIAKRNSKNNKLDIKILKGNLLYPIIKRKIKVDVIISNPPYLSKEDQIDEDVIKNEPPSALFGDINNYIKILKDSKKVLNDTAIIAFESSDNIITELEKEIKSIYKNSTIKIEKDLLEKRRYIFIFINIDKKI